MPLLDNLLFPLLSIDEEVDRRLDLVRDFRARAVTSGDSNNGLFVGGHCERSLSDELGEESGYTPLAPVAFRMQVEIVCTDTQKLFRY